MQETTCYYCLLSIQCQFYAKNKFNKKNLIKFNKINFQFSMLLSMKSSKFPYSFPPKPQVSTQLSTIYSVPNTLLLNCVFRSVVLTNIYAHVTFRNFAVYLPNIGFRGSFSKTLMLIQASLDLPLTQTTRVECPSVLTMET